MCLFNVASDDYAHQVNYGHCFTFSLGLVGDDAVEKKGTPIDTLCNYLAKQLTYGTCYRLFLVLPLAIVTFFTPVITLIDIVLIYPVIYDGISFLYIFWM